MTNVQRLQAQQIRSGSQIQRHLAAKEAVRVLGTDPLKLPVAEKRHQTGYLNIVLEE